MVVAYPVFQNAQSCHGRHQWRQSPSECRASEAGAPRAGGRSLEPVAAGDRRGVRGLGSSAATRACRASRLTLSRDSPERGAPREAARAATAGQRLAAAARGAAGQTRAAPSHAAAPGSNLGACHQRVSRPDFFSKKGLRSTPDREKRGINREHISTGRSRTALLDHGRDDFGCIACLAHPSGTGATRGMAVCSGRRIGDAGAGRLADWAAIAAPHRGRPAAAGAGL